MDFETVFYLVQQGSGIGAWLRITVPDITVIITMITGLIQ